MEDLNNVPSTGTFGNSIGQVNQNFGLVKGAIENLEGRTIRSKGLYPTQAALTAAYPSPKVGDYAYVGSGLPATIYDCLVEGTWHNTGQTGGSETIDLGAYSTTAQMNTAIDNGLQGQVGYAVCNSNGSDRKDVVVNGFKLLPSGGALHIKMTNVNTAANATMNISPTSTVVAANTKPLFYNGAQASPTNTWDANEIISVYYDGTNYQATNSQGGEGKAEKIKYDNSQSGLASNNVQGAVDKLSQNVTNIEDLLYDEVLKSTISPSATSGTDNTAYFTKESETFTTKKIQVKTVSSSVALTVYLVQFNGTTVTKMVTLATTTLSGAGLHDIDLNRTVVVSPTSAIALKGSGIGYYINTRGQGYRVNGSTSITKVNPMLGYTYYVKSDTNKVDELASDINNIENIINENLYYYSIYKDLGISSCTQKSDGAIYGNYTSGTFNCSKIRVKITASGTVNVYKVVFSSSTSGTSTLLKTATFNSAGIYDIDLGQIVAISSTTQIAVGSGVLAYLGSYRTGTSFKIQGSTISNTAHLFGFELYEVIDVGDYIDKKTEGLKVYANRPSSGYEIFSVSVNYFDEDLSSNSTTEVTDTQRVYPDYGAIALPTNYDPLRPTRLIVLCGGTSERINSNSTPLNGNGYYGWKYYISQGYAVMDMNGVSNAWGTAMGFQQPNQHFCNKYLIQSYRKGINYVMDKYNLYDEIFVMGISMGGGAMAAIVQSGLFKVRASCGFCPALSVYKNDYMQGWNSGQQSTIAGQNGFDNWATATQSQAYFLENLDKIIGYDNLMVNTFGSVSDINAANNNYNNTAETNAYEALAKYYPCPLKIWHAENDNVVAPRYSKFFVKMIKNGGGKAWYRSLASGAHSGGWNSGSVSDTDIDGNTVTTSINFFEAKEFIQRYE